MSKPRHFLPDRVRDLAAPAAEQLEGLRRRLLDYYMLRGYALVTPPLLEYADALTSGAASDLKRNLFYVAQGTDMADVDAPLALRADFTPQIARLDSISAQPGEVLRYCYAGSILLKQPRSFTGVRNPLQLGAELLGSESESADNEILGLMLDSLMPVLKVNFKHTLRLSDNRIIQRLCELAALDDATRAQTLKLLQRRSLNQLAPLLAAHTNNQNTAVIQALIQLPCMFGAATIVTSDNWKRLAALDSDLAKTLARLEKMERSLATIHPQLQLVIDLADMSGYAYHNALTFALYSGHAAIAQGGRYDGIGHYFGRSRAAIGFSIDMDVLYQLLPDSTLIPCVWVAFDQLPTASGWVNQARADGTRVICALSSNEQPPTCCTHRLAAYKHGWNLQPIGNTNTA